MEETLYHRALRTVLTPQALAARQLGEPRQGTRLFLLLRPPPPPPLLRGTGAARTPLLFFVCLLEPRHERLGRLAHGLAELALATLIEPLDDDLFLEQVDVVHHLEQVRRLLEQRFAPLAADEIL